MSFLETEKGIKTIDIVPFKAGKGNPFAEPGELYFERTFWTWRRIGPEEKSYCCLHKCFGEKDPIQEWKNEQARNPNADQAYLKALSPKERQLFLVWDHADRSKLQIWEVSHHLFGKLLDNRIKNSEERMGWDQFYFPDEDGMSLRLTFSEESGGGYSWVEVSAIDFIPREEPLPSKIVDHGICLDDLIVKTPYNELRKIFLGVDEGETADAPARKTEEKKEEKKAEEPTKKEEPKQEKKEEKPAVDKKATPVAADFGLKTGDEVMYKKKLCTIAKISGDGTSLTLCDPDDEIIRAVGPEEVKKAGGSTEKKEEPKKEEPKQEKKKEEKSESKKDDDDSWDFE